MTELEHVVARITGIPACVLRVGDRDVPGLLKREWVMSLLGVKTESTIERLERRGSLACVRFREQVRYTVSDYADLVRQHQALPGQADETNPKLNPLGASAEPLQVWAAYLGDDEIACLLPNEVMAALLATSVDTLDRLRGDGLLTAVKLAGNVYFTLAEYFRFVQRHRWVGSPPFPRHGVV